MSEMYTDKVRELFLNPKNMGEIKDADAVGEVGNPACGDIMKLYLKVENNIIKDVKFKTFGCAAAIATSSQITEMAIGKTLEEAYRITMKEVTEELGGLPKIKMHCSNLAAKALRTAIEEYWRKHGMEDKIPKKAGNKKSHQEPRHP